MQYNNPTPVAVIILPVIKDNQSGYLGIRRNIAPHIGGLAFPGGFVDEFEGLREAGLRELYEETGFKINDINSLLFVHEETFKERNQSIIFFVHNKEAQWDEVQSAYNAMQNSEVQEISFLNKNTELCFPIHNFVLQKLFAMNKNTNE